MFTVTLIGTGNVAWHLASTLVHSEKIQLCQVAGRNAQALKSFVSFAPTVASFDQIKRTDIVILAVSDDAVADVAQSLHTINSLIVHTSGSVKMDVLDKFENFGVLYPLQTFSKARELDLSSVPICVEANTAENLVMLGNIAGAMSTEVVQMSSRQRESLHLAAVMANNFSNHLLALTEVFCKEHELPFQLLENLMTETIAKAFDIGPAEAQTGPAQRGDYKTLKKHLEKIDHTSLNKIYNQLTNSILKSNGKAKL